MSRPVPVSSVAEAGLPAGPRARAPPCTDRPARRSADEGSYDDPRRALIAHRDAVGTRAKFTVVTADHRRAEGSAPIRHFLDERRSIMVRRLAMGLSSVAMAILAVPPSTAAAAPVTKVLVFSKTAGFRHSAIPNGIAAIRQLGAQNGFSVTATEDATQFSTANLAQYQAVVWLSTTGDVLNDAQQTAFQSYIAAGGGYVGVKYSSRKKEMKGPSGVLTEAQGPSRCLSTGTDLLLFRSVFLPTARSSFAAIPWDRRRLTPPCDDIRRSA